MTSLQENIRPIFTILVNIGCMFLEYVLKSELYTLILNNIDLPLN